MKEDSIIQIEVKITKILVGKIQKDDKEEIMIIIKMIHDNIAQVRGIIKTVIKKKSILKIINTIVIVIIKEHFAANPLVHMIESVTTKE